MRRVFPVSFVGFVVAVGCATGGEATHAVLAIDEDAGEGGAAAAVDAGVAPDTSSPPATCVHNDDCKAANLCVGNGGQACVGGFCVATGKPQNCDDGVACTNDSCDANKNACVHAPNDASCPSGSYCDVTSNCVQTLPCKVGDSVCDRLNTSACDGLWSCDTTKLYCVRANKPCPDRTNATTSCVATGTATSCSWACAQNYGDMDNDLNVPVAQTSNGCECHITDPIDRPTLAMVDGNCDGIVGNIANAILVDVVSGFDGNPGTMASPMRTLQAGINKAAAAQPTKDVYVSKGTYSEAVSLADGVSIFGGYDASSNWKRALTNGTLIGSPSPIGVAAMNLTKATEIQLFSVTSSNATGRSNSGDGLSSFGVRIVNSSGGVTVRGCTLTAGSGYSGALGSNGAPGSGGGSGTNASGSSPGSSGAGCNGANGGTGAGGVSGLSPGGQGGSGTQVPGGGTAASGGGAGIVGDCSTTNSHDGHEAPTVSATGGQGNPGANGGPGGVIGAFDGLGNYLPPTGGDGITVGSPGGGGGGGGSGGGSAHSKGPYPFCDDCGRAVSSGGGGGGGGGGCGGQPGHGGRGGGGSFGLVALSSMVTIDGNKVATGNGGNGGAGGNGGGAGGGGGGGTGAGGQSDSGGGCSTRNGGAGASGTAGGPGGQGGGGAGGTGGASVCIAYKGTSPTTTANQCITGGFGTGGQGGTNGLFAAPKGSDGVAVDLRAF